MFGYICLATVGIRHFVKAPFAPLPLQTVAGNDIRYGLRVIIRFFVRKSIMGSHHDLLSTVPFIVLIFRHRSNHHPVYPSRIVIRSLNLIPAGILQYLDRHSKQRLRTHPGRKLTFIAHITNRNMYYPISRISRHGAYFLSFQTNYRYYQQAIEKKDIFLH